MYQVITMYGDNEPWWFFDDWEKDIQEIQYFQSKEEAISLFNQFYKEYKAKYPFSKPKEQYLIAFWNEDEVRYCEECEEDLQQYKGILLLKENQKIVERDREEFNETINHRRKAKCCKRPSESIRS